MHQRERTCGQIAWGEFYWEGLALKMQSCWHGFYTEELLHGEACTQGTLHTEAFTHRSFTRRSLFRHR